MSRSRRLRTLTESRRGILDLFWWDELMSPSAYTLTAAVSATDTNILLSAAGMPTVPLIQIGGEILEVIETLGSGSEYRVLRGAQRSTAEAHGVGDIIYHLKRSTQVVPFVRGFFGSEASHTFRQSRFTCRTREWELQISTC